ncbi:hypothetical protein WN943_014312 [Citrus x changshan-huyou]
MSKGEQIFLKLITLGENLSTKSLVSKIPGMRLVTEIIKKRIHVTMEHVNFKKQEMFSNAESYAFEDVLWKWAPNAFTLP